MAGWSEDARQNPPTRASRSPAATSSSVVSAGDWIVRSADCQSRSSDSEPEPDLAWPTVPESEYFDRHPGPEDIRLVVEVADSVSGTTIGRQSWLSTPRARIADVLDRQHLVDEPDRSLHPAAKWRDAADCTVQQTSPQGRACRSSWTADCRGTLPSTTVHRASTTMTTYLDNAATSFPKPEAVYQALDRFARHEPGQPRPGRAQDGPGRRARPRRRPAPAQPASSTARARSGSSSRSTAPTPSTWRSRACCKRRRPRHHHRPGAQQRQPAAAGDGAGRPDHPDAAHGRRRRHRRPRRDPRRRSRRRRGSIAMTHASNVLGTVQPIARDRPDRPRARRAVPGRCRPDGRRRCRSTCRR